MKQRLIVFTTIICLLCCTACSTTLPGSDSTSSTTAALTTTNTTVTTATTTTTTSTTRVKTTTTTTTTTRPKTTTATTVGNLYDTSFFPVYTTADYYETCQFYHDANNQTVEYLFHRPLRQSNEPMPLVIFLHGKGDTVTAAYPGTAVEITHALMALENEDAAYSTYTLVPVTPLSNEGDWSYYQILAFKILLHDLVEKYNIDKDRIYLSGISMGGFMTCRLVSEMPDFFAAAVPLSGAQNMSSPDAVHGTVFRIYHVATDPIVGVSCSRALYQQLLDSQHPNVTYIEYPDGNHISPLRNVFKIDRRDFFRWLFSQRRS